MKCKAETPPPYFIHLFVPPVRPSLAPIFHFTTPLSNADLHTVLFYHKQLQTKSKKYKVLQLMSRKISRESSKSSKKAKNSQKPHLQAGNPPTTTHSPLLRMSIIQEDFFKIFHPDCLGGIWAMPHTEGPKSKPFLLWTSDSAEGILVGFFGKKACISSAAWYNLVYARDSHNSLFISGRSRP